MRGTTLPSHGEFTRRVWRHLHRDGDGTRFEFDVTIDGLVDASSHGVGEDPQRLRQLASVVWATADELGEARARQATPRGWHRVKDLEWVQDLGDLLKVAQVRARALGDQQIPLLRRTIVIYIT